MPTVNLKIDVRRVNAITSVIEIHGEVTAFAESILTEAYSQASSGNAKVILLNFEDLAYMNSSGIGLLVTMLIRANRQKQKLIAVGLNEHYQQIFQLTRLDEAIGIFESEGDALETVVVK